MSEAYIRYTSDTYLFVASNFFSSLDLFIYLFLIRNESITLLRNPADQDWPKLANLILSTRSQSLLLRFFLSSSQTVDEKWVSLIRTTAQWKLILNSQILTNKHKYKTLTKNLFSSKISANHVEIVYFGRHHTWTIRYSSLRMCHSIKCGVYDDLLLFIGTRQFNRPLHKQLTNSLVRLSRQIRMLTVSVHRNTHTNTHFRRKSRGISVVAVRWGYH